MNIQTTKLEIIKIIADVQSEPLLNNLLQLLKQEVPKTAVAKKTPKPALSEEVSALLLKINEGLPKEIQERYNALSLKTVQETLSTAEHEELLKLVPKVEAKTVERLTYLVELAQLWKMSVDEVMEKLDIQTPPVIHA